MPDLGLKSFDKLYPMMIRKYQDLIVDQNASEADKINSIILKLNALGKLSNDVVRDWNTVYNWAMNDGLNTDVSNKIELMKSNGELDTILQGIFNSLTGDMTTLHTTAKDTIVNSINEVDDLAKSNQTQLAQKANKTLVYLQDYKTTTNTWDDALTSAINALPTNVYTTLLNDTSIFGGGEIIFPYAQQLTFNNTISIRPRITLNLNYCMITSHASTIIATTNDLNHYNRDDVFIINGTLNGDNVATTGIDFTLATHSKIDNVMIIKCVGNGIEFRDCQWCEINLTEIYNCGGFGLFVGKMSSGGLRSNNNLFTRVKCENNTQGGCNLQQAHVNSFYSCTFQFSKTGIGMLIDQVDCFMNLISNCHFEDNYFGIKITNSGTESLKIDSCSFNSNNTTVYTNIYNSGYKTVVTDCKFVNPVQNHNIVQTYGTGSLAVFGYDDDIFDASGVAINQSYASTPSAVSSIRYPTANNGIRFTGFSFSTYSTSQSGSSYANNYLQIGAYRVWIDGSGNLRTKNASNPTSDTDGNVFIQNMSGTTRPSSPTPFQPFYDKTNKKPITFNNDVGKWLDSNGVAPENRGINVAVSASATSLTVTFPTTETDSNYLVNTSLGWNSTYWITGKSTTGFTINFGTSPVSASTLDWSIKR